MSEIDDIEVQHLQLDLQNFRTVPQADEIGAIQAMIAISPNKFWGLTDSLLDSGYLPTENIIVLRKNKTTLVVREGNRRIAALKLIHGIISIKNFDVPEDVLARVKSAPPIWKSTNKKVPCAIYNKNEEKIVDRIVTLTHGKGEKASRENWEAVARARHNRDINGVPEPALDLLEKFLSAARIITKDQERRWAGDYPITVLDETIKKAAKRFGAKTSRDLAEKYPSVKYRQKLDEVIKDIGTDTLTFKKIRAEADFLHPYGVPELTNPNTEGEKTSQDKKDADASKHSATQPNGNRDKKGAAVSTNDPRAVKKALKAFTPVGNNREKVVTLKDEALNLNLEKNPLAFCFLLRSMFEISAKAYCLDHKSPGGLSYKQNDGQDKPLGTLLKSITTHLTANKTDKEMLRKLHGASAELAKSEGLLSVTSMNQLVHNPSFTVVASDISSLFGNIFPLLQAMNE